jgi:starvation-inducible DNA-binding protein
MSTATAKPAATARTDQRVIDGLNLVLADSYALMALTHLAHWNVEGPDFFPLHKAFQEQYEDLFEAVDEIAERVRALGAYALGGLNVLARTAQMEEFKSPLPQKDYVAASSSPTRRSSTTLCAPGTPRALRAISRARTS